MRVLVCGGRDFNDRDFIYGWLGKLFHPDYGSSEDAQPWWLPRPDLVIISGAAKGADSIAEDWAIVNWVKLLSFPADWDKYGKSAGYVRNKQMLEEGKPDMVLAFPGGRGTADMVSQAKKARVPCMEIYKE